MKKPKRSKTIDLSLCVAVAIAVIVVAFGPLVSSDWATVNREWAVLITILVAFVPTALDHNPRRSLHFSRFWIAWCILLLLHVIVWLLFLKVVKLAIPYSSGPEEFGTLRWLDNREQFLALVFVLGVIPWIEYTLLLSPVLNKFKAQPK